MLLGLQYTKTLKIKASNEVDFQKKIDFFIESWECGGIFNSFKFDYIKHKNNSSINFF